MKTKRWLMFKLAGLLVGMPALVTCPGQSAAAAQDDKLVPAVSGGATNAASANTAGLTNVASTEAKPRAKIPPVIPTSPGLAEIVKLAQAGVEPDVLLAYVENSEVTYNPTADELVYLHDVGISPSVVTALVQHGNQLRNQAAPPALASHQAGPSESAGATAVAPAVAYHLGYPAASPSYNVAAAAPAPDTASPPPEPNQFYDSLAPYGTWYDLPDYGWSWQPSVAVNQPLWRPYCDDGRWLNSDAGWYWQSDYSWGWAPFHYGRWCRYGGLGWTWVPGSDWGPSWVSWRQSPLYCGWAPLPPAAVYGLDGGFSYFGAGVGLGFGFGLGVADFTFVPFNHFCDWNLARNCLAPGFAGRIFNGTTIHNNYSRGPNGRILNLGVDPARVAAASRSEIPKVAIRDLTPAAGKVVKPDRLERDGSSLVVYRPQALNNSPAKAGSHIASNRQELAPQSTALGAAARGASVTALKPVTATPQSQARLSSAAAASQRNLVPVVRLPYTGAPTTGAASSLQNRGAAGSIAKQIETRPNSISTTPPVGGGLGSRIPSSAQSFTPARSMAVQPSVPFLGRYPTQAWAARPTASYSGAGAGAASLPVAPFRDGAAPAGRQEVPKSAFGGPQSTLPSAWTRPGQVATVRPSFYSAPPITQPPGRSAYESAPYNYRSAPAASTHAPAYSSSPSYARPSYNAPSYSYRPQAPSAGYDRAPSYSSSSSYGRPSYSAPSYSSSSSYTRPSYSAPSYSSRPSSTPSYHSSGGYSGGSASGGRSSGGSFSSRSNR
ncbi:MAG: DUF6600 domain-containing protein [Limisphaerales bacterium]